MQVLFTHSSSHHLCTGDYVCVNPLQRTVCAAQGSIFTIHRPPFFLIKAFLACHTQSASLIHTQLCSSPMHRRLCMCQSTTENSVCCTRVHFYHSPSAIFFIKAFLACHTQSASLIHTQLCSSPMHRRLCMCQSTTENSVCCTRVHFYHSPSAIFFYQSIFSMPYTECKSYSHTALLITYAQETMYVSIHYREQCVLHKGPFLPFTVRHFFNQSIFSMPYTECKSYSHTALLITYAQETMYVSIHYREQYVLHKGPFLPFTVRHFFYQSIFSMPYTECMSYLHTALPATYVHTHTHTHTHTVSTYRYSFIACSNQLMLFDRVL